MLLDIYPNELKTYLYKKTYTHVFVISLFMIGKIWKQPKCPLEGTWVSKLCYMQWNIIQH